MSLKYNTTPIYKELYRNQEVLEIVIRIKELYNIQPVKLCNSTPSIQLNKTLSVLLFEICKQNQTFKNRGSILYKNFLQ